MTIEATIGALELGGMSIVVSMALAREPQEGLARVFDRYELMPELLAVRSTARFLEAAWLLESKTTDCGLVEYWESTPE